MLNQLASLGQRGILFFSLFGRSFILFLLTLLGFLHLFKRPHLLIKQLYAIGVLSVLIILVSGLFVGMVMGLLLSSTTNASNEVANVEDMSNIDHEIGISDPFEPLNRQIFKFNEVVDEHLAIPVAQTWQYTPAPLRTAVSNFFSNLDDIMTIINDLLQLKFEQTVSDTARFVTNSSFGLLGIFDVATDWGMPKHVERFADSMGYWGIDSGPYLMIPIWGPSSVRDGLGLAADIQVYPLGYYYPVAHRNTLQVFKMVNDRANLLDATELTTEMALDSYTFTRDSYYQYRQNQIYDGNPPVERLDDPEIENLE